MNKMLVHDPVDINYRNAAVKRQKENETAFCTHVQKKTGRQNRSCVSHHLKAHEYVVHSCVGVCYNTYVIYFGK